MLTVQTETISWASASIVFEMVQQLIAALGSVSDSMPFVARDDKFVIEVLKVSGAQVTFNARFVAKGSFLVQLTYSKEFNPVFCVRGDSRSLVPSELFSMIFNGEG